MPILYPKVCQGVWDKFLGYPLQPISIIRPILKYKRNKP